MAPGKHSRPRRHRKLTFKQRKFIKAYIKNNGNGTQAALEAYNTTKPTVAGPMAVETLKNPNVQDGLAVALETLGISDEELAKDTYTIVKAGIDNKDKATPADSLRGIETLLKLKGHLRQGTDSKTLHLEYNAMSKTELLKERKKLKGFWEGIAE